MPDLSDKGKGWKGQQESNEAFQVTASAPERTADALQESVSPQSAQGGDLHVGQVISKGAEGVICLQPDGKVLKVYFPGRHYNPKVLPLVKSLNGKGFLVDVYDYGVSEFQGQKCDYELMQYCPLGPVSSRKDLRGNADAILKIAFSTALALDACHKAGFIHKDVKPANILIENEKTWHCLLCDFGISDVLVNGQAKTLQNRTPIYASPEMYDPKTCVIKEGKTWCKLTPATDYYSLGMTILSLWLGESAFMAEVDLAYEKREENIEVPEDMPEPLRTITQGLLVANPEDRWSLKEMLEKKAGKDVKIRKSIKVVYSHEKNQIAHSIEELAAFMVEDLGLAKQYIYTGMLSDWLKPMPELQAKVKEIVRDTQNNQDLGCLQVIHTLNPLYDINLNCKTDDPTWAMNDQRIGEVFNKVYYLYFTKYRRSYDNMTRYWDADDAALIHSPLVAYQIAKSFESEGDINYVAWFLKAKGNRFAKQLDYFRKRLNQGIDNKKKIGPKDRSFVVQVGMMRTIAGFNATPTYRLDRTDIYLRSLDDLHKAPAKKLKDDLSLDKGLRGWLAVMHQENPRADLSKKYRYEMLLEQYVQDLGFCDSNDRIYQRYSTAQKQVKDITAGAKAQIRHVYVNGVVQKVVSGLLAFLPAVLLLVSIILNAIDNPVLDMDALKNKWVFYSLGLVFAALCYFLFFEGDGGCLVSIIVGAVASVLIILLLKFLGQYLLWIYAAVVLAVIVLFVIMTLFQKSKYAMKVNSIMNPGFVELTIDPLHFAFSNEATFHPINEDLDPQSFKTWKNEVSERWKVIIIFVLVVWGLIACGQLLPNSSRMSHFNRQMKSTLFTNDTIPAEEEIEPEPSTDGSTAPFVKPKHRGIIRDEAMH